MCCKSSDISNLRNKVTPTIVTDLYIKADVSFHYDSKTLEKSCLKSIKSPCSLTSNKENQRMGHVSLEHNKCINVS